MRETPRERPPRGPFQGYSWGAMKKVPAQVGPFRIEALLGRGGSAEVYRGRRPGERRDVAVKVARRGASRRERRRFVEEARLAEGLDCPHLVSVLERDLEANRPWIAMELVPGVDLATLLRTARGRARSLAPRICTGVLQALQALHEGGLTHGDVAPANVLVGEKDHVLLLDLGRLARPGPERKAGGTLAYMDPEGLRGEPQGPEADVYQLGAVLYEVLSGMVPHEDLGGSYTDYRRAGEPPAELPELVGGVSSSVAGLVHDLLAPEASSRPSAAQALRRARNIPAPWYHGPPVPADLVAGVGLVPGPPGRSPRRQRTNPGRKRTEPVRAAATWPPFLLAAALLAALWLFAGSRADAPNPAPPPAPAQASR